MQFTAKQIEQLIALGAQITAIGQTIPAPPVGADRTEWAASLRPTIAANEAMLNAMLELLQGGANPTPDTLSAIATETTVAPEPEKASMAERWAATFPTPAQPVPDNIRFPRVLPHGEFQE